MRTSSGRGPGATTGQRGAAAPPGRDELHRLYVVEDRPIADLMTHYRVGKSTVSSWLRAASIPIRSRADGGRRRQLQPPPTEQLQRWCQEGWSIPQIQRELRVSRSTTERWLTEAGLTARRVSSRNCLRGSTVPVVPPERTELDRLYVREGLSVDRTAERLGASRHLVRNWLAEYGIALRAAGGRPGVPHRLPARKPPPPVDELRVLREQRLTCRAIAVHYSVHPQTVTRWLRAADLPPQLPPAPGLISDAAVVELYRSSTLTATEVAHQAGTAPTRVLQLLRAAGVSIDPDRRRAAAARRAATRPVPPALPSALADRAEDLYVNDGWSYNRIARELSVSVGRIRRALLARGIEPRRPLLPGRGSRADAPIEDVRQLYVECELPAIDVAALLDVAPIVVLRTGHAHGLPIRSGGHPLMPAGVQLIEGLYADPLVSRVLDEHQVPRRPAGGGIAQRFPVPVPLTYALLDGLYTWAGCSSPQVELLTGQAQMVVRERLHAWGIPLRGPGGTSPVLQRLRERARAQFRSAVAADYRRLGSTTALAAAYGCSSNTVARWLVMAGVPLPRRGTWSRAARSARAPGRGDD